MFLEKSGLMVKISVFVVFVCVSLAGADVIYVDISASGLDSDPNAGISWERAYVDLQNAIGAALSGDDIWVAEGIYKPTDGSDTSAKFQLIDGVAMYGGFAGDETVLEDRNWEVNETHLSGNLEGTAQSSYVVLSYGVGDTTVLDGFIVTGGDNYNIYCYQDEAVIRNCFIEGSGGDGIYCHDADPVIDNCIIEGNGQDGINPVTGSSLTMSNCVIRDNTASGIYCYNGSGATVINSWIHHNGADGILFYGTGGSVVVRNNTVAYNTGSGIKKWSATGTDPVISNCIVWGNDDDLDLCSATYSCIEDADTGTGNISSDPGFAYSNTDFGNFHLLVNSDCVDAGDDTDVGIGETDIDGDDRVYDSYVDMGGDEAVCADVYSAGDVDGDGYMNFFDFEIFAGAWLSNSSSGNWNADCDLDGDEVVDANDIGDFMAEWMWKACYN